MKKLLLLFLVTTLFTPFFLSAQFDCSDGRFDNPAYFENVSVTEDIKFGENVNATILDPNAIEELFYDIYEPEGDTSSYRPLIIWAFGGAFVAGNRKSADIVELCERYSRAGYVNMSIDYRLTQELLWNGNPTNAYRAVMKAMHDMKAAVRYIRKDIEDDGNTYRIHPDHIYAGGVSAGGFTALHSAYLDSDAEIPAEIIPDTATVGGLEGLSGTPGYSSEINGVINLCGGLGDSTYLDPGDVPVVSMHGTADETVPYGSDIVTLFNLNLPVDGSASIHVRAQNVGVHSALETWYGVGHVPFGTSAAYMDSTFNFTKDFMLDLVCSPITDVEDQPLNKLDVVISPNPVAYDFTVELKGELSDRWIYQLTDLSGRVIQEATVNQQVFTLNRSSLPSGMYLLRLLSDEHQVVKKLVFE